MPGTGLISGKDATITFATGYVVKCKRWTIDVSLEEVDTTALGDDWKSFIAGVSEWSGTYECLIDSTKLTTMTAIAWGNAAAAAVFVFDEPASTDGSLDGSIIITGFSPSAQVEGGASAATFNFRGSGALTITPAA